MAEPAISLQEQLNLCRDRYLTARNRFGHLYRGEPDGERQYVLPFHAGIKATLRGKYKPLDASQIRRDLTNALREKIISVAEFKRWHEILAAAQSLTPRQQEKVRPLFAAALGRRRALHQPQNP